MSEWVGKEPCPKCDSTDNLGRHQDGHGFCFGCGYYEHGDGTPTQKSEKKINPDLIDGTVVPLEKRKLTVETCQKWGYKTATFKGSPVQIATYCDERGNAVAQKLRFADKKRGFPVLGDAKKMAPLYGQWLWRDGGRMIVVTEGELDALSVSQLQGNKWPVVSVPFGADGAAKFIRKASSYLEQFETVVFMFDNDDPGREAAKECAELLTPGKAKIASLPLKDASDMLQAGRGKEVIDAIWGAKTFRPDGIVNAKDTWERVKGYFKQVKNLPLFPWPKLNEMLKGFWPGRIILLTSGTGVGKSTICAELADFLRESRPDTEKIGYIALEENVEESDIRFMSLALNKPLLFDNPHDIETTEGEQALKAAFDKAFDDGRMFWYDHWGSLDGDNLIAKIKYLARAEGCRYVFLDHISIVISGDDEIVDERRTLDRLATKLRSLANELKDVTLIIVSHLSRQKGTSHEEGGQVSLSHLRGSHSLAQIPDIIIAGERDQQGDDPNLVKLRILKNRPAARTGLADELRYQLATGRLVLAEGSEFKPETEDTEF